MKKIAMLAVVLGLAASCQAQDKNQDAMARNQTETHKPNEKWTVNKKVDENGNIIKYDSIYSWSSSGNAEMITLRKMDSLMGSFSSQFQQGLPGGNDSFFEDFFNGQSAESSDFFSSFFSQDSLSGSPNIDAIKRQMQTLQQQFMAGTKRQPIIPAEPEKAQKKHHN